MLGGLPLFRSFTIPCFILYQGARYPRGGGGGGVTSTHNKRGCVILIRKVVPKSMGTYPKLRLKNPRNLKRWAFLLREKIYHPDKKVLDIKSTFEFYLFYQKILIFNFCFTMFVQRVLIFL